MRTSVLVVLAATALQMSACNKAPSPGKQAADAYEQSAKDLLKLIDSAGAAEVQAAANKTLLTARPLVAAFSAERPMCKAYLDATWKVVDELATSTSAQVEDRYHKGTVLPKASDECYHAKDLVVHPASVVVLSREAGAKSDMAKEINEVLGHLQTVRAVVE